MQDHNASVDTIFDVFVAIANALSDPDGGEPGYRLRDIEVITSGARTGRFAFLLTGSYFPRGHLGDYSISETRSTQLMEVG